MSELLKFVSIPQVMPEVRDPETRAHDFHEIYGTFAARSAAEQASRCSQCGVPFCQVHCPLQNNIPDWLKLTAEGRLQEAYQISSATNTFPEICGRICPQDRLCEGNCVIEKGFEAVTIGAIEKYLTENAFDQGWVEPIAVGAENGRSVGIIGAGPAGLAAAEMLRRKGFAVHVYDRYDCAGGLLMYGIPSFKLEKQIVSRRIKWLEQAGIIFNLNCSIGEDITFSHLREQHDALLIATGVYKARELSIENTNIKGVVQGLAYLTASNRNEEIHSAEGKKVVVIGGGDTAMDCVRTAIRQGASSVTCLYRRDKSNMPGSRREVKNAEEEGVQFIWTSAPKAFEGDGQITKIIAHKMRLGAPDANGRQVPTVIEDSQFALDADMAILALGFDAEDLPGAFGAIELGISEQGTLAINNATFMTSMEGVFAAGDIVRGASLVVWAIKDGRDAAEKMEQWIMRQQ